MTAKSNTPAIAIGLQTAFGNRGTLPEFGLEEQCRPVIDVIALKDIPYGNWGIPGSAIAPVAAIAAQSGLAALRPGPNTIVKVKRIRITGSVAAITNMQVWYVAQIQLNGAIANVVGPLRSARMRQQFDPGRLAAQLDNNTDWGFNGQVFLTTGSLGAAFGGKLLKQFAVPAGGDTEIAIDAELNGSGTNEVAAGVPPANAQNLLVMCVAPVNNAFVVTFEFDEWPLSG